MKILIVDHYDSFTYNLFHQVSSFGVETDVIKWDECESCPSTPLGTFGDSWDKIILSPGPGRPDGYSKSQNLVQKFYTEKPILGVCLGHQMIGELFGSHVIHAEKVMHGKTSEIQHAGTSIFEGVKNPFEAARYHSLILDTVPKDFEKLAWADDIVMAIKHKDYPLFGVQFHPESFLTSEGEKIMKNFLNI
jgi:anthranilate synthase/aminodeoxychorismate synthase-like glutamine amidotransferase